MTNITSAPLEKHSLKQGFVEEAKKAFILTIYFGAWFCALTFLGITTLDERPIPLSPFGFALIKAGICAKFMLIAVAVFPIKVDKDDGVIKSLFIGSIIYLAIVIALNYLEAGVEGLIHGKEFFISMSAFGQANPLHVLSMAIVYWLMFGLISFLLQLKQNLGLLPL
jgi:hypothetical protein